MGPTHVEHLREASLLLRAAESGVRVLRSSAWKPAVRERFLAVGSRALPRPTCARPDLAPKYEALAAARRPVDHGAPGARWLVLHPRSEPHEGACA